jgi:hypothetical protein
VIARRKQASQEAEQKFAADQALAARFDELLAEARSAEQALHDTQAAHAPLTEQYRAAKRLDTALTDSMRAAYAAAGPGLVRRGRTAAHDARESPADRHSPDPAERGLRRIG